MHQVGGRRAARPQRACRTSLAEINVVPLVDVMLVLLIIFMVTAPMMQQGLEVNLPQARRADRDAQPIYRHRAGRLPQTRVVQIDRTRSCVSRSCSERMRQAHARADDKSVFVRADGAVTMQDLMYVIDKLKEAGVEKVGLMSKPVRGAERER